MTTCPRLLGSYMVKASMWSVGLHIKKIGVLLMFNGHIITSTLHRAKEMVVKMWNVNGLVDY